MGTCNGKEKKIIELKTQIVTIERLQAAKVKAAVKRNEEQLGIEHERVVEEERARAGEIEEQRSVVELENELLTEMVAAEQVNVKLYERRIEALKWELLRQGGTQEQFKGLVKEQVPDLEATLDAETSDVVDGMATHDMAGAVEHVVLGVGEVGDELQEAFSARDKETTGVLGESDFKDALRECLPDLTRADRQLLALRFVREADESIDYAQFLSFCRRKAESRERLKMGLTGALAATRTAGALRSATSARLVSGKGFSATVPSSMSPGERAKPFFATALMLSRTESPASSAWPTGRAQSKSGLRGKDSIASQGTIEPALVDLAEQRMAAIVSDRGQELEAMFATHDPSNSRTIPVEAFSQALRALGAPVTRAGEGQLTHDEHRLTRDDRKSMYRKWARNGQVSYDAFLRGHGYYKSPPPRYSDVVHSGRRATQDEPGTRPDSPSSASSRPSAQSKQDLSRETIEDDVHERTRKPSKKSRRRLSEGLRIVLVHLSEVLHEEGEEVFFAAFEGQDLDNRRRLDEDEFIDAMASLAPEVTVEQALNVFRFASGGADDGANYDRLFKDLKRMAPPEAFVSGEMVQLKVEQCQGKFEWIAAQIVSSDLDGTYTVRFKSAMPGGGHIKESGVPQADLRKPRREAGRKAPQVASVGTALAVWFTGLTKRRPSNGAGRHKMIAGPSISGLMRRFSAGKNSRDADARRQSARGRKAPNLLGGNAGRKRRRTRRRTSRKARSDSDVDDDMTDDDSRSSSERAPRRHRYRRKTSSNSESDTSVGGRALSSLDDGGVSDGSEQGSSDDERAAPTADTSPPSPTPALSTRARRGARPSGNKGAREVRESSRRMVELPVIHETSSPPRTASRDLSSRGDGIRPVSTDRREKIRDKFGRSPAGVPRRSSRGTAPTTARRKEGSSGSSGGGITRSGSGSGSSALKSLEVLQHKNIEDKFDLYKKRAKDALSPEKTRSAGSRRASASRTRGSLDRRSRRHSDQ